MTGGIEVRIEEALGQKLCKGYTCRSNRTAVSFLEQVRLCELSIVFIPRHVVPPEHAAVSNSCKHLEHRTSMRDSMDENNDTVLYKNARKEEM